ncbi:hypothetical protein VTJ49DRAFT_4587 [Mycothermus thermophilus]|uniref:F-box domain-containing protein n=1 Tax=Humicola insolens TaxID=85995 RepID=A0ABR3V517_HUMIN
MALRFYPNRNGYQPFRHMPNEIIILIGKHCANNRTLSCLSRINRRFHTLLFSELWLTGANDRPGKPALYWAIEMNDLYIAHRALKYYDQLGERAKGILEGTTVLFDTFTWLPGGLENYAYMLPASFMPLSPLMRAVRAGWGIEELRILYYGGCPVDVRRRINMPNYPAKGGGLHTTCTKTVCQERFKLSGTEHLPQGDDDDQWTGPRCEDVLHDAIAVGRPYILEFLLGELNAEPGKLGRPDEPLEMPGDSRMPLGQYLLDTYLGVSGPLVPGLPPPPILDVHDKMITILERRGFNMGLYFPNR